MHLKLCINIVYFSSLPYSEKLYALICASIVLQEWHKIADR